MVNKGLFKLCRDCHQRANKSTGWLTSWPVSASFYLTRCNEMNPAEMKHLQSVDLTSHEKKAVLALLRSGVTYDALDKLGLEDLMRRLTGAEGEGYDGPWEYNGLQKAPSLKEYGLKNDYVN